MIEAQGYFLHLAGTLYLLLFLCLCCSKQQKFFCCQDESSSRIITVTLITAILLKIFFPLGQWFLPAYFAVLEARAAVAIFMAMLAAIAVSYLEIRGGQKRLYLSLLPVSLALNSFILYWPYTILLLLDLVLLNMVLLIYLHSAGGKGLLRFCTVFFLFFAIWIAVSINGSSFLEKTFESQQRYKVHSKLKMLQKRFVDLERAGSSMAKIIAIMFTGEDTGLDYIARNKSEYLGKLRLLERLSGVSGIYLLDKKGHAILESDDKPNSYGLASLPIFRRAISGSSGISFLATGQGSNSFFARPVIYKGEIAGALLLRYSLSKYFMSDFEQEGIFLIDRTGKVILGPSAAGIQRVTLRDGNQEVLSAADMEYGVESPVLGEPGVSLVPYKMIHIPLFGGDWSLVKLYNPSALFKLRAGLSFVFFLISLVLMLLFLRMIYAKEFIARLEHEIFERKKAQKARELLADVVDQAIIGILIADKNLEIQYVNKCFQELTNYTLNDLKEMTLFSLFTGISGEHYSSLQEAVSGGIPWRKRVTGIPRKDDSRFDADVSLFPLKSEGGRIQNFVVAFRDISHELALEAQLLEAHKMEAVGVLAGGVAHDFNNMLAVIQFSVEIAKKNSEPGSPLWHNLDEIERTVQRASSIVRQLLLFSKGKKAPLIKVNLNQVLHDLETMLRQIAGTSIEIELRPGSGLWDILADKNCIELVLSNLMINARDAMPEGGKIVISTYNLNKGEKFGSGGFFADQDSVCLEIEDNGYGMDSETKAHIFDPFFTTKDVGKGTGLGLSVVYGIIKQFGGRIEVDSMPGSGTVFYIMLPRPGDDTEASHLLPGHGVETRFSGYGILLVEDEEMVKNIVRLALSEKGYRVFCASDVGEAQNLLNRHEDDIDLVLCDIVLPDKNGLALAETLRKYYPEKKIVMVSGHMEKGGAPPELSEQDLPFLAKPFTMADLFGVVARTLSSSSGVLKN